MKRATLIAGLLALALPVLAGGHAMKTESGWFDMENCAFCKNLLTDPGLLEHATWESHNLEKGMLYIMTVEPEYAESMAKASAAMEELGTKMHSGQINPAEVKMCGSCQAFGQLMMAGVKMETIKGDAAEVTIVTHDDPQVIAQMHDLVARNQKEMALLMSGGEHEGQQH
ncbi:MAG TPA: hypothetical protein PLL30_09020 [Candidatus Krumholzibacteria bacterium]|nr:hypothetical protein [Candidatus Krumholzibacteria bacterium]HPD71901.1 hypothetical protein [Candidatus Krumholzibacteria bacterium]HRY41166.1 hypothetical protein [Candidatus Krumholzibacteria bacterium]